MIKNIKTKNVNARLYNIVLLDKEKQAPRNYVDIFSYVFRKGAVVATGDDKRTKMFSLSYSSDLLLGTLYNFTKIKDGDWYDESSDSKANPHLDPNLNPNLREWSFYFYPECHCLLIPSQRNVSFTQIEKYFSKSLCEAADALCLGEICIDVVSKEDVITDILKMEEMKTLSINVHVTNNDNNEDAELLLMDEELKNQGICKVATKISSSKDKTFSLKSNTFITRLLGLSKRNGDAVAEGRLNNKNVKLNTHAHPKIFTLKKVTEENMISKVMETFTNYFKNN